MLLRFAGRVWHCSSPGKTRARHDTMPDRECTHRHCCACICCLSDRDFDGFVCSLSPCRRHGLWPWFRWFRVFALALSSSWALALRTPVHADQTATWTLTHNSRADTTFLPLLMSTAPVRSQSRSIDRPAAPATARTPARVAMARAPARQLRLPSPSPPMLSRFRSSKIFSERESSVDVLALSHHPPLAAPASLALGPSFCVVRAPRCTKGKRV
jgi:hypothetical protein